MEPQYLHAPQANMSAEDSKPNTFLTFDGTTCNDKELQQGGSEPYKMDLASDTGGHLLAITLEPICLLGWWS